MYDVPTGLAVLGSVRANLRNVTMAHNTFGVTMGSVGNIVNIENLMVSFASTGLRAGIGQTMRVANSVVTQNATGINANTGTMISMSNNSVTGNTTDGAFSFTVPQQ